MTVGPDLNAFLPPAGHPKYLSIVRELVCVDIDYGWARGEPTPLEEYRQRFPALFADPEVAQAVVWEDYRQRRQAGQEPDLEDYRRRFGVSPTEPTDAWAISATHRDDFAGRVSADDWAARLDDLGCGSVSGMADLFRATHQSNPAAAEQLARTIEAMPRSRFVVRRVPAGSGLGTRRLRLCIFGASDCTFRPAGGAESVGRVIRRGPDTRPVAAH